MSSDFVTVTVVGINFGPMPHPYKLTVNRAYIVSVADTQFRPDCPVLSALKMADSDDTLICAESREVITGLPVASDPAKEPGIHLGPITALKVVGCGRCGRDHDDVPFSVRTVAGEREHRGLCAETNATVFSIVTGGVGG